MGCIGSRKSDSRKPEKHPQQTLQHHRTAPVFYSQQNVWGGPAKSQAPFVDPRVRQHQTAPPTYPPQAIEGRLAKPRAQLVDPLSQRHPTAPPSLQQPSRAHHPVGRSKTIKIESIDPDMEELLRDQRTNNPMNNMRTGIPISRSKTIKIECGMVEAQNGYNRDNAVNEEQQFAIVPTLALFALSDTGVAAGARLQQAAADFRGDAAKVDLGIRT
ncbi:hypothetical protein GGR51DRAFT_560953 [Nemania sp. FL0031]|nr:hypothetical protein GGR51DRAFT_560953 [Nemania sp. FL0031]